MISLGDEEVRHLHEEPLADAVVGVILAVCVTSEPLPGQPAHGWRHGEAVIKTRGQVEAEPEHCEADQHPGAGGHLNTKHEVRAENI